MVRKVVKALEVRRATFDNYVREGKLPRGKHEAGFKELSWSRKDLDSFVQKCNDNRQVLLRVYNSRAVKGDK